MIIKEKKKLRNYLPLTELRLTANWVFVDVFSVDISSGFNCCLTKIWYDTQAIRLKNSWTW
jgi:hypothetical protein